MNNIESNKGEIVMYQPDQSVIARHIRNIYKEEELDEEGTYAKFAYMGHDGMQETTAQDLLNSIR